MSDASDNDDDDDDSVVSIVFGEDGFDELIDDDDATTSDDSSAQREEEWRSLLYDIRQNDPTVSAFDGSFHFRLNDTMAEEFVDAFQENSSVRVLKLDVSNLSAKKGAKVLAPLIAKNQYLNTLELSCHEEDQQQHQHTSASGAAEEASEVIDVLLRAATDNPSVTELRLEDVFLGHADTHHRKRGGGSKRVTSFQRLLKKTNTLKYLRICQEDRTWFDETTAAHGLEKNSSVETLEFEGVYAREYPLLGSLLRSASPSIKVLKLKSAWSPSLEVVLGRRRSGGCSLEKLELCGYVHPRDTNDKLVRILASLESNDSVKHLVLRTSSFRFSPSAEFYQGLSRLFRKNSTIEVAEIELDCCGVLRPGGMEEVARGLCQNTSVHTLKLIGWPLYGSNNVTSLRDMLRQTRNIKTLCIRSANRVVADAVGIFSHGLRYRSSLTHLDVSGSSLENEGVKVMCDSLRRNRSLEVLLIRRTRFSFAGLKAVLALLDSNHTLQRLDISRNQLSLGAGPTDPGPAGRAIRATLESNNPSSLVDLNIESCGLSDADIVPIFAALASNDTLKSLNVNGNNDFLEGPMLELGERLGSIRCLERLRLTGPGDNHSNNNAARQEAWDRALRGFKENESLLEVAAEHRGAEHRWRELQFYLARNKVRPYIYHHRREGRSSPSVPSSLRENRRRSSTINSDANDTSAVPLGVWPFILSRAFAADGRWKDPVVQVSLVQYILCRKPSLVNYHDPGEGGDSKSNNNTASSPRKRRRRCSRAR